MSEKSKDNDTAVSAVIVDDDPQSGRMIARYLESMGLRVTAYTDSEKCLAELAQTAPDVVITDLRMPKIDGLGVLEKVKKDLPSADVIIVTGNADKKVAIQALKLGAFDFFEKPVDSTELLETIKKTLRYRAVIRERDRFADQVSFLSAREAERWGVKAFIGRSRAVKKIVEDIKLVQRTTTTSVLITGESGTGKELVARAIHFGGTRASHPFIPVNCCAVSPELAESVLFGHTKGAFTGATADVKGCFDMADKGTLFLDEIGDMPASLQTKLLRVLEDGVVVPVGKTVGHEVDVRVVAATNSNLQEKIASGRFRSDLYYRLGGFTIHVPPLRERPDDIPLLAKHFAEALSADMGRPNPGMTDEAIALLKQQSFPGNVRQLRNVIEQALIHSRGGSVEPGHLHVERLPSAPLPGPVPEQGASAAPADLPLNLRQGEAVLIRRAMAETEGNVSAAAKLLGINRTKLYRKLSVMGLAVAKDSAPGTAGASEQ